MTALPGSWIKKPTSETSTSEKSVSSKAQSTTGTKSQEAKSVATTGSTKTQTKAHSRTSTKQKPESKTRVRLCTCGHPREKHKSVASNVDEAHWDGSYYECGHNKCDCVRFTKQQFVRTEHLTNRPFADNTGMIVLKDRLTPHDGTHNTRNNHKEKK